MADPAILLQQLAKRIDALTFEDSAEFRIRTDTGGKILPVGLAQGPDEGVAVFLADAAVRVAMAVIQPRLFAYP
jgi:hypothetical protein